jgi:hypothetical protein
MRTRLLLGVSLGINLCLLGVVVLAPAGRVERLPAASAAEPVGKADLSRVPEVAPTQVPTAFHWSQLESTNYQSYIANLRAVGCPEQTIRDIIAADLSSLSKSARLPGDSSFASGLSYPAGRFQFLAGADSGSIGAAGQEQQAILNELLGPSPEDRLPRASAVAVSMNGFSPAVRSVASAKSTADYQQPLDAVLATEHRQLPGLAAATASQLSPPSEAPTIAVENVAPEVGQPAQAASEGASPVRWQTGPFTFEEQLYRAQFGWQNYNAQQLALAIERLNN